MPQKYRDNNTKVSKQMPISKFARVYQRGEQKFSDEFHKDLIQVD